MTEKEKGGSVAFEEKLELEQRSQSDESQLLSLPEPGSQERLLAERKLVRKLDARLLPTIIIIYIMNYIDVQVLLAISSTSTLNFSFSAMVSRRPVCKACSKT
jgi:hypothetical protein